jgi:hypothetical protein
MNKVVFVYAIFLTFVTSSFSIVCTGGNTVYSFTDLPNCNSFSGITSQTSIIINGLQISNLSSLSSVFFDRWPGAITITNTSITSLNGLNLNSTVGQLQITNNQLLSEVVLPISGINVLRISNNEGLFRISFPLVSGSATTIDITNNTQLQMLSSFNSLTSITTITIINNNLQTMSAFNLLLSASTITVDESRLINLDSFKVLQTLNTLMLFNLSISEINGWRLQRVNSLQVRGLKSLTNLKFMSSVTTINNVIQIVDATALLDYTGLNGLTQLPPSYNFKGSCCPSFRQYSSVLSIDKFFGCVDCFNTLGLSIEKRRTVNSSVIVPSSGGVFVNISYQGSIQTTTVNVSFGSSTVVCPVDDSNIRCITPSFNGTMGVQSVSFNINNKEWISSNLSVYSVRDDEYLNSDSISEMSLGNSVLVISGVIDSKSVNNTRVTYLVIGIMLSLLFITLVLFMLRKKLKNISSCCRFSICCNVKIFKPLDFYYDFNEELGPEVTISENRRNLMHPLGPLLHRKKTTFGGLMFFMSTFVSCCLIILLVYQTANDGLNSSLTLTPRTNRIQSMYSGYFILHNFNRECTTGELDVSISGFSSPVSINVGYTQDNLCKVEWLTLQRSDITVKSVVIKIKDSDLNSLFTRLEWSAQSIDHFGNPSISNGYMNNGIFKGIPTQINLLATPIHYTGYKVDDSSGVLTSYDSQYPGIVTSLSDGDGVSITMNIELSSTDLSLIIALKQSILSTIGIGLSIMSGSFTTGNLLNILYHLIKRNLIGNIPQIISTSQGIRKMDISVR